MTHPTALRNTILCVLACLAAAACGATSVKAPAATTGAGAPVGVIAAAPSATPDPSALDQSIGSIDNQLNGIDSQVNAADAGLSATEGDPAQ
jgi:hypothetical protein